MLTIHRVLGTWTRAVDLFIALSQFARNKFIEGGLPGHRVIVKPNFTSDPGIRATQGSYALFVGRLSEEKGVSSLLSAWHRLGDRIPLKVIGDGPGAVEVARAAATHAGVEWLGTRSPREVAAAMAGAKFLVFPSVWYETFGLAIIEAYAVGLPVIASNVGVMSSLVEHQRTGLHFQPGDAEDLARQVLWALSHQDEMLAMGRNAREVYEAQFTPQRNYELLMQAYTLATSTKARADRPRSEGVRAGTPCVAGEMSGHREPPHGHH
jgi:glycosyltransferase involved in cell wall biosynthesis